MNEKTLNNMVKLQERLIENIFSDNPTEPERHRATLEYQQIVISNYLSLLKLQLQTTKRYGLADYIMAGGKL